MIKEAPCTICTKKQHGTNGPIFPHRVSSTLWKTIEKRLRSMVLWYYADVQQPCVSWGTVRDEGQWMILLSVGCCWCYPMGWYKPFLAGQRIGGEYRAMHDERKRGDGVHGDDSRTRKLHLIFGRSDSWNHFAPPTVRPPLFGLFLISICVFFLFGSTSAEGLAIGR